MSCSRCQTHEGVLGCPHCARRYCCRRCLHFDTHYGPHTHGPVLATHVENGNAAPRYAQTCAVYPTWASASNPMECVIHLGKGPDATQIETHRRACSHSPLVQPLVEAKPGQTQALTAHLPDSIYLHLGEDAYESPHVLSLYPFRARYPQVDLVEVVRTVGQGLGQLHMKQGSDTYGFGLTWSRGQVQLHLDVLHTNILDPDTPESIQAFGSVLGLSPYVPSADQKELFQAFCEGYASAAGVERTREVAEVMKSYLS